MDDGIARAKQHGMCVMGARPLAPPVPHRPVGRAGGGRGLGLDPLRQRDLATDRRALRRRGRALRHQPGDRRHPDAERAAVHPRHGHQRGGAGQDPRRAQQGREGPARLADRRPGPADRRSDVRRRSSRSARCAPSACTRATAWRWCANCSAARSPAAAPGIPTTARRSASGTACSPSSSIRSASAPRRFGTETTAFLESLRKSPPSRRLRQGAHRRRAGTRTARKRERDGISGRRQHLERDRRRGR